MCSSDLSGIVALSNAGRTGTAGTLADKQMEAYRALPYNQIALQKTLVATAASPYASDSAYAGTILDDVLLAPADITQYDHAYCSPSLPPVTCRPVLTVTGPDGRSYRVDTYITWSCPTGAPDTSAPAAPAAPTCAAARPLKKVTVVVRDGVTTSKTYVRETSTFDRAT